MLSKFKHVFLSPSYEWIEVRRHAPFFLFILYILLFLTGMAVMRSGLMTLSGESVNIWISRFTKTPLIGMISRNICHDFTSKQFCRDDYCHWFNFGENFIL